MIRPIVLCLTLALWSLAARGETDTPEYVIWTGAGAPGQEVYHLELARAALKASEPRFGPARLEVSDQSMPVRRGRMELRLGKKMHFQATTVWDHEARDEQLIIVPEPLEQGLLGYRRLLIRSEDAPRFAAVKTPEDLKPLVAGLGKNWPDHAVLTDNDFNVGTAEHFDGLFPMLMAHRIDYIPLGVEEIDSTLEQYSERFPELAVTDSPVIYYPMPVYWMVCACRPELAQRLEVGMQRLRDTGQWQTIFERHKAEARDWLEHHHPTVFTLENQRLPHFADTPGPVLLSPSAP